jgi:hypothetical protein
MVPGVALSRKRDNPLVGNRDFKEVAGQAA